MGSDSALLPDCHHFFETRAAIGHVSFASSNPPFGDLERGADLRHRIFLRAGENMRVQVEGDADLAVTEPFAGDLHVDARGEHVRRVRVPQVMGRRYRRCRRSTRWRERARVWQALTSHSERPHAYMCREKPWPVCLRARIDERRLKREGMTLMSVTKKEAIGRLDAAGHRRAAAQLSGWRNKLGNDWGWEGWFRGEYPNLIDTSCGQREGDPREYVNAKTIVNSAGITALSMKPSQTTDEAYAGIPALLEQGVTKAEIAAVLGVKPGSLAVCCSRRGISLRKGGRRPRKLVLTLGEDVLKSLRDAAHRLGKGSAERLVGELLGTIVSDDLYKAVLDEEATPDRSVTPAPQDDPTPPPERIDPARFVPSPPLVSAQDSSITASATKISA